MKFLLIALAGLTFANCHAETSAKDETTRVVSPDGHNEISLWSSPLAYEVRRDGVVIVTKTEIGLDVNGAPLAPQGKVEVRRETKSGTVEMPIYKKSAIDLAGNEAFVDFGEWGVRLAARNDGVAYRFETEMSGSIRVNGERARLTIPDAAARCWAYKTRRFGIEESIPHGYTASELKTKTEGKGGDMIYPPFAYAVGGKFAVVTESDVRDYPIWNFVKTDDVVLDAKFAGWPAKSEVASKRKGKSEKERGRWVKVIEHADYLVETDGTRSFPWRCFVLADKPSKVCEADLVTALAAPQTAYDFSWVRPGKVAWDWWNFFDNGRGCNTKTYERFIDFAASNKVEYVILDEGWSESLNIWKYHKNVDVPYIIDYANARGVGIILWMAWAQAVGDEERVAEHFAKLGAKGFKVDFMDRGDAELERFLWKFADACAKNRMLVDYHGAHRPTGMSRAYPNVVNYEGIHGLEQTRRFNGDERGMLANDVMAVYLRLTAGPMDYTPGAMLNHAVGSGYRGNGNTPGAVGTRSRQMAMMALYEAPLQMLCDSPTNYEKNQESFAFMADVPVVWARTLGLGGCPDSMIAAARQAKDGAWYAAGITDIEPRDYTLDTSFLGEGEWKAEIFRDAPDADRDATHYVHEQGKVVRPGEKLAFHLAPGGGFIVRFSK